MKSKSLAKLGSLLLIAALSLSPALASAATYTPGVSGNSSYTPGSTGSSSSGTSGASTGANYTPGTTGGSSYTPGRSSTVTPGTTGTPVWRPKVKVPVRFGQFRGNITKKFDDFYGAYPPPAGTGKVDFGNTVNLDLSKLNAIHDSLEEIINKTTVIQDWEKAREQIITANKVYIAYLKQLRNNLKAEISARRVTSISTTDFIDREIYVIETFNSAYATVTRSWISEVEQRSNVNRDDATFAMEVLAGIGTAQVIYNGYASALVVAGGRGLVTTSKIDQAYDRQYAYATTTLYQQIENFAKNRLGLTGSEYDAFYKKYKDRVQNEVVAYLNTVNTKNIEAAAIFTNDVKVIDSAGTNLTNLANALLSFISNPQNITTQNVVTFIDQWKSSAESIMNVTKTVLNTDYRAKAQMEAIVTAYKKAIENTLLIVKDLLKEWQNRYDDCDNTCSW